MIKNKITTRSVHNNLSFPDHTDRPFLYSSFVATIDGKIQVRKDGYWPIGSETDYATFTYLRSLADIVLDGKHTALQFGTYMIDTIHTDDFVALRESMGKKNPLPYGIMTSQPETFDRNVLNNQYSFVPEIIDTQGKTLTEVMKALFERGHKHIFVDGGPSLIASLLKEDLLDELYLTIAPKIFGNTPGETLTLVEGFLFPPDQIKKFTLASSKQVGEEVFLRYTVLR